MGRWAWGYEISCGRGGCRNLAVWLLLHDRFWGGFKGSRTGPQARKTFPVCGLHLNVAREHMIRHEGAYSPEVVPFQDPALPPRRKRRQQRPPWTIEPVGAAAVGAAPSPVSPSPVPG